MALPHPSFSLTTRCSCKHLKFSDAKSLPTHKECLHGLRDSWGDDSPLETRSSLGQVDRISQSLVGPLLWTCHQAGHHFVSSNSPQVTGSCPSLLLVSKVVNGAKLFNWCKPHPSHNITLFIFISIKYTYPSELR